MRKPRLPKRKSILSIREFWLRSMGYIGFKNYSVGNAFVAVCLFFFAFSSVIVWNLFSKINCKYLWGKRSIPAYLVVSLAFIFCGTMMKSDLVWELQDLLNQLMVLPNVAALIALSGSVAAAAHRK